MYILIETIMVYWVEQYCTDDWGKKVSNFLTGFASNSGRERNREKFHDFRNKKEKGLDWTKPFEFRRLGQIGDDKCTDSKHRVNENQLFRGNSVNHYEHEPP